MRHMKKLIPILLVLVSCTRGYLQETPPSLVVEGWIDAGGPPVVMLTTSVTPTLEFQSLESLQDHILKWAKVTISDGDRSVVLMGKPTDLYDIPYIYTTAWMDGEPGKTYTLTVDYENFHATAVTTIPPKESLKEVKAKQLPNGTYGIEAVIDPKPDSYYRLFTRVEDQDKSYVPSFLGVFSGRDLQSEAVINVNAGRTINRRTYSPSFPCGSTVHVKFCTMDEASWRYWSEFEKVSSMGGSPIFPVRFNISSNVTGALGYWAGYAPVWYTVTIPQ